MAVVSYGDIPGVGAVPELDQAAAGRLRKALLEHGTLAVDMTKRELLAAQMLSALLANPNTAAGPRVLVEDAVCYADRLLAVLEPGKNGG